MIIDVVVYNIDKIKLKCFLFKLMISFKLMIKHVTLNKNSLRLLINFYVEVEMSRTNEGVPKFESGIAPLSCMTWLRRRHFKPLIRMSYYHIKLSLRS